MANVYTRTGDQGTTGLFGGSRTLKNDLRVDAYGTSDEAECSIGFARSIISDKEVNDLLLLVQKRLFALQAQLASDEKGLKLLKDKISQEDVDMLEERIDHYLEIVGKQFEFVRPGDHPTSAALHVARSVVRRAERRMIDLKQAVPEAVDDVMLRFINRLSDLLFVLARYEDHRALTDKIKEIALGYLQQDQTVEVDDPQDAPFLTLVKRMAAASRQKAFELGIPIVFAAVDKDGNLCYLERQADSLLVSIDVAQKKAYTAVALKLPTADLKDLVKEDGEFFGLQNSDGGLVVFGGGYPIFKDGKLLGAIGVSGGNSSEDTQIAEAGLSVMKEK